MDVRRAKLRSLAKINLDLRVLHKNPDGYHELRSVFQTISLADTIGIEFEKSRRTDLSIDDPDAIPDNLILRAAKAALDAMKINARVRFSLRKQIPMGGGLGGGSSNAAAVLMALPVLAGKPLPMEARAELASALGSDVPFFLLGGTAAGLGRGAELYPLADLRPEPLLVVSAGLHVATGPAYSALGRGLTFAGSSRSINNFQAFVRALGVGRSAGQASAFSANDFEAAVFRQHPQLETIGEKLWKLGAMGVRMTGSGSAMVGIFGSREQRDRVRSLLQRDRVFRECRVFPASLVSGARYRRLWCRQLAAHLGPDENLWPPQSRYER
jgi:4-diphosphocytidyl-2-C-methyl-D-erythritol kinase